MNASQNDGEQVVEVVRDAAASWPTISIFCACRTRSSISLAAVMSVMVPIRPVDSPDAS
ncbi:MAG: hypothetical protein IPN77_22850 [Sandaracinaceae bacterium]|nr:hypothetical protein [Sandaracinaceae bacterium]